MFGLGAIPSLLQLVALFFCSESPSWLLSKGKDKASFAVLEQLRRDHEWESHLKEMKSSAHFKQGTSWGLLFSSQYMRVLLIGLILSVFQQITGINTVIYFAPEIFRQAGFTGETASLLPTMGIGILNIIATTLSLILLDRSGRRILLQIGTFGMLISLVLFVWALMMNHSSTALISTMSIFGYVFFFSMSLGPVTWVVLAEIYPLRIRGTAMAIVIFANWLANYLLTLTFLDLLDLLTAAGTFGLFALLSGLAWWFITKFLPETKGKTLEQIEKLMCKKT